MLAVVLPPPPLGWFHVLLFLSHIRSVLTLVLSPFLDTPTVLPLWLCVRGYLICYPGDIDRNRSQVLIKSPIHSFQLKSR